MWKTLLHNTRVQHAIRTGVNIYINSGAHTCGWDRHTLAICPSAEKSTTIYKRLVSRPIVLELVDKLISYFMSHVVFNVVLSETSEKIPDGVKISLADLMKFIETFLSELENLMCIAAERSTAVCNEILRLSLVGTVAPAFLITFKGTYRGYYVWRKNQKANVHIIWKTLILNGDG